MESLTQCFLVLGRLKKIAAAAAVDMAQSKELEFMLWLFVLFDVGS